MNNETAPKTSKNSTSRFEDKQISPAFSTNAQTAGFLILVIFALVLPILITNFGWVSRRDSYQLMPETWGPYTFVEKEVFENREDIDVLFIGSSFLWSGIDTPQIQKALSERLGRDARALTFGHSFNSIDIPYMQVKDLLEQKRRVRLIVLSVPRVPFTDSPSISAYKFLRYSDDRNIFNEFPAKHKISLYAASVLRAPHDLVTMARRSRSKPSPYAADLGAQKRAEGWEKSPFEEFSPPAPAIGPEQLIYSAENQNQFKFTGEEMSSFQKFYFRKLLELLKREGIPLAMVNVPQYAERASAQVVEVEDWSKSLGTDLPLVGIPPARLFAGLSEEEIKKFHYNEHLNKNGNEFFTRAILPAILEIYDRHAAKN